MKYLLLALSLFAVNVYADQIETSNGTFNTSQSGSDSICKEVFFIKRNIGTVIKGLSTSNLMFYTGTHTLTGLQPAVNGDPTESVLIDHSVTPVNGLPGVYNVCIIPKGFAWTISDTYEFRFVINKAADNGSLVLKFQN